MSNHTQNPFESLDAELPTTQNSASILYPHLYSKHSVLC